MAKRSGFVPTRYPGSEDGDAAIRLARSTEWHAVGDVALGRGQRMFATDGDDIGLLEVKEIELDLPSVVRKRVRKAGMSELTPQERLQPSLLDRLADDERVIAWRLDEDKARLLEILDDQERAAFEKLFDVEQRRAPRLVPKDFEPFARLTEEQKALLERVVMLEQQRRFESREQRVMSLERLKQSVLRDLSWLLNTEYFEAVHSLDAYPEVRSSVLNYGIPSIVGLTITDLNDSMRGGLAKTLRDAIVRFEPRLDPDSIVVRTHADKEQMDGRTLTFEIEAELLAEPAPLRLLLTSVVDLENGHATLAERAA